MHLFVSKNASQNAFFPFARTSTIVYGVLKVLRDVFLSNLNDRPSLAKQIQYFVTLNPKKQFSWLIG